MTSEPNGGDGTGISPNIALLVGAVAYALVNFVAVMSLILRFMGDPFSVLRFFAFVAPVAACAVTVFILIGTDLGERRSPKSVPISVYSAVLEVEDLGRMAWW